MSNLRELKKELRKTSSQLIESCFIINYLDAKHEESVNSLIEKELDNIVGILKTINNTDKSQNTKAQINTAKAEYFKVHSKLHKEAEQLINKL